jgi:hypothetical protein
VQTTVIMAVPLFIRTKRQIGETDAEESTNEFRIGRLDPRELSMAESECLLLLENSFRILALPIPSVSQLHFGDRGPSDLKVGPKQMK